MRPQESPGFREHRARLAYERVALEEMPFHVNLFGHPPRVSANLESTAHLASPPTKTRRVNVLDGGTCWLPHEHALSPQELSEMRVTDAHAIESFDKTITGLLLLATLFAILNAVFIIESCRNLKPDQAAITNDLLRVMIYNQNNPNNTKPYEETIFVLDRTDCASIFFLVWSLLFCVTAATLGLLCKQWLNHFRRRKRWYCDSDDDANREWLPQMGRRVDSMVERITLLLMLSLFLFFLGLVTLLAPLGVDSLWAVLILFIGCNVLIWVWYTLEGVLIHDSPFQTPFTRMFKAFGSYWRRLLSYFLGS
ncbi:hypothetical protein FRC03_012114 [Tulasnella sp. 419]|nr:hypothetical protein FRC03_012114 [Tulasnella sp. 419]